MGKIVDLIKPPQLKDETVWIVELEGLNRYHQHHYSPSVFPYRPGEPLIVILRKRIDIVREKLIREKKRLLPDDQMHLDILNGAMEVINRGQLIIPVFPDPHAMLTVLPGNIGFIKIQIAGYFTDK